MRQRGKLRISSLNLRHIKGSKIQAHIFSFIYSKQFAEFPLVCYTGDWLVFPALQLDWLSCRCISLLIGWICDWALEQCSTLSAIIPNHNKMAAVEEVLQTFNSWHFYLLLGQEIHRKLPACEVLLRFKLELVLLKGCAGLSLYGEISHHIEATKLNL